MFERSVANYKRKLNIIDESGKIIGEDTRENIHKKGLHHREVWVLFYTPQGEIIFQRRSFNAEAWPGLLDGTVGGHVEIGMGFTEAAIQETEEETGLTIKPEDLKLVKIIRSNVRDPATGAINNPSLAVHVLCYRGKLEDLKPEQGVAFEAWPIEKLFNLSEEEKKRFLSLIEDERFLDVFRKIKNGLFLK